MVAVNAAPRIQGFARSQAPARRFLPCLPTLWPSMLAPFRESVPLPFPFQASRSHAFYFARNAVWYGARMLGLSGQEVLVPAYHHGVEVEALIHAGCRIRYVRVDGRMRLDIQDLANAIGPATRAIYVIHYAGFAQPMEEIMRLARGRGLRVIEDCALSLLSADGDAPLGTRGDLSVFCLYKTLPVPNGGILVVNGEVAPFPIDSEPPPLGSTLSHAASSLFANAALRLGPAGRAFRQLVHRIGRAARATPGLRPISTGTSRFEPERVSLGMSALSWLILGNLEYPRIVAARRRNYFLLLGRLRQESPPVFGNLPAGACPLFYPLLCPDKQEVQERLAARGIETVDFWRAGHPSCPAERYPEVALLRRRVLELPIHQDLDPDDMSAMAEMVKECLR